MVGLAHGTPLGVELRLSACSIAPRITSSAERIVFNGVLRSVVLLQRDLIPRAKFTSPLSISTAVRPIVILGANPAAGLASANRMNEERTAQRR